MKKIIAAIIIPLGLTVTLCGCGQTGRTITNNMHIDRSTIYATPGIAGASAMGEFALPTDTIRDARGGLFQQNSTMWVENSGTEEGTGRNSTSIPVDVDVPLNQTKGGGTGNTVGGAIGVLADKTIDALGGGGDSSTPAVGDGTARGDTRPPACPDGNCGDSCADGSCTVP